MSRPKIIDRGVETEIRAQCIGCRHYLYDPRNGSLVNNRVCINPESDHYRHFLSPAHPGCEGYESK